MLLFFLFLETMENKSSRLSELKDSLVFEIVGICGAEDGPKSQAFRRPYHQFLDR
jgi:hypothetical protein